MSVYQSKMYDAVLQRLRTVIEESKVTQAEVGERLGIKQSAVSSLLSGRSKINLEQFIAISEIVGARPHSVLTSAEHLLFTREQMSEEMENTIYNSPIHLLAFCAASREISAESISGTHMPKDKIKKALDELVRCGALTHRKGKYIQKDMTKDYTVADLHRLFRMHERVYSQAWDIWLEQSSRPEFRLRQFNKVKIDRFTFTQMREIHALLWKVEERLSAFQKENHSNMYSTDVEMPLWTITIMAAQALEAEFPSERG